MFPFKYTVKAGNIDRGERLSILISYKDCLRQKCYKTTKEARNLKQDMKDVILEALCLNPKINEMSKPSEKWNLQETTIDISEVTYPTLAQVESMPQTQQVDIDKQLFAETVTRDTVYQICGYLLYTRRRLLKCLECLPIMQTKEELLPADFYHHCLTDIKSKAGLKMLYIKFV